MIEYVLDNINEILPNQNEINGFCMFALAKCADTIDHKLLKKKKYGINDTELLWFTNYLNERTKLLAYMVKWFHSDL